MAVFRPTKIEWRDILNTWRKESQCAGNLPKTILPSILYKVFHFLKHENLLSGFRATGIVPLQRNEVLKKLPSTNNTPNVNAFSFNQSVLEVLKENAGVGQRKREKQESELSHENKWELMICCQRTRKMKSQHLQNGKRERKRKFQEKLMKMKMTICEFTVNVRNNGMTMTKTVGFCETYMMQNLTCNVLDFSIKLATKGI